VFILFFLSLEAGSIQLDSLKLLSCIDKKKNLIFIVHILGLIISWRIRPLVKLETITKSKKKKKTNSWPREWGN